MVEQITEMLTNVKIEILDPVMVKGLPKKEDFKELDRLADEILNKHRGIK